MILLYGAETWACTKTDESKLQTVEIKVLRGIVGKTRRDTYSSGRPQDGGNTEPNQKK
jgi:hypothetical protein